MQDADKMPEPSRPLSARSIVAFIVGTNLAFEVRSEAEAAVIEMGGTGQQVTILDMPVWALAPTVSILQRGRNLQQAHGAPQQSAPEPAPTPAEK